MAPIRAIDRAFPIPLVAGITAAIRLGTTQSPCSSSVITGSSISARGGRRVRVPQLGDPGLVGGRAETEVEVGAERPGDLLAEELVERQTRDPTNEFTEQEAVRDRVVVGLGARFVPGLGTLEDADHPVPVVGRLEPDRLAEAG